MRTPLFFLGLTALTTSFIHAQLSDQVLVIREGGQSIQFQIACDELQCHPGNGGVAHATTIAHQGTAVETAQLAYTLEEGADDRFDLVLYQVGSPQNQWSRRSLTRRILVQLAPGHSAKKLFKATGAASFVVPDYAPDYAIFAYENVGDSLKFLPAVRELAGVVSADPLLAKKRAKRLVPNDPRYAHSASNSRYQWHLKNTGQNGGTVGMDANVEMVWDSYLGTGVTIGIVDDGLEVAHPDLAPNANTAIDHDWNDGTPDDPTPTSNFDDHGTACAGVAAAKGNNSIGVSGSAPEASLVGLRLIAGDVGDSEEAEAMNWRNDVIQIKSNSWGPPDDQGTLDGAGPLVRAAFEASVENGRGGLGTIHVWAAGNGGSNDNVNYDGYANSIYTIAVGAITDTGERADYSEPGAAKVISAPSDGGGQSITTTTLTESGSYTDNFGGTSSATPLVSGVIALMLEANPGLGWRDVQEILIQSAVKINPSESGWITNGANFHFNHDYGAGRIDADAAVQLATTWMNLPDQESLMVASGAVNAAIPENSTTGVSTTFDFTGFDNLRVEHVTLTANIAHPARGQLTVSLISPSGTESLLAVPHSGREADFENWTMMTVFNWGEDSAGVWTLKVTDTGMGQTGLLQNATMTIFGGGNGPATDPPEFVHAASASGNVESPFNVSVRARNAPTSYTAMGLPDGLMLNEINGVISGEPTEEGDFEVALTATNAIGTTNGTITIEIGSRIPIPPMIASEGTVVATLERPFIYQIEATNSPTSYDVSPPLPLGLSLDTTTGVISGTFTTAGDIDVTLSATNSDGTDTAPLKIRVMELGSGPIAQGLDTSDYLFIPGDDGDWFLQTTEFINDGDAVQPRSISDGERATFSTEISGPGFLSFQWKVSSEEGFDVLVVEIDGDEVLSISGETDWALGVVAVPEGVHTVTWGYQKDGSESEGQDTGWIDQLTFAPGEVSRSLGDALDYPGLPWQPDGSWTGQTLISNDGEDSLQSPNIDDGEDARLTVELEGPGTFSFFYRCESEEDFDVFSFSLDGDEEFAESGLVEWTQHTVQIPAGTHTLSWAYRKDGSISEGADSVWLDQVSWQTANLSGYQAWANLYFTLSEQASSPYAQPEGDADGDRRSNLYEYAFNTHPLQAGIENEPTFAAPGSTIEITYEVDLSKIDISYRVVSSTNLETWLPIPQSVISTAGDLETRRAIQPSLEQQLYMRVEIEQLP